MINREDMLELTRRMTLSRTSFTRIAGCYVDSDGDFDGSFNTNFLKLSAAERTKKLKLAKEIPFSPTNVNLKKYEFTQSMRKPGSMWQLLMAMNECGLKNDALMDTFYDVVMEKYRTSSDYTILVFHDRYDIPAKASDNERLWESEEVFEYMICAICPLTGEYEPGKPECGFLFPAFTDRSGDLNHIAVFQADTGRPHDEILEVLGLMG
ncbi:DUF4317 domain-containing protein [Lachnoclostridium pacaense]|uniref:DUF4317 family protein n=1 Tax=Enterocloster hominis (ex Hitch et al. 2024) TaxID=1917870 RepID=UPI001D11BC21|nr:DUF4317 family protein [Lachnoclostridium pacaense]MCC2817797.1 DUF4317 domain-containing protein [Lachnoclostridium pacaense]